MFSGQRQQSRSLCLKCSFPRQASLNPDTIGIWVCMILFSFFSKIFFFLDVDNF